MGTTLAQIAQLVQGQVVGDPNLEISGAAIIRDAIRGEITLADRPELVGQLAQSRATAVLVPRQFDQLKLDCVVVEDVHAAFGKVIRHFRPWDDAPPTGIHRTAVVALSALVHPTATIGAGTVIGEDVVIRKGCVIHAGVQIAAGSELGENVHVFPGAVLYERTIVGNGCIIHANAVLGAFGFGYESSSGRHLLGAQLGNVVLEADVEIGAGTTIDRGTYGPTLIGEGTKIDNLVQIGHNCRIGRHNLLCSQVGIAGSTTSGDYVVMAGQVGVRDHVHIGTGAMLGAKAGIHSDIDEGQHVLGSPNRPVKDFALEQTALRRLPEMRKTLKALARRIEELEQSSAKKAA